MAEAICADLHLHSSCSDGGEPPAAMVRRAAAAGLAALALTDHDTLAGVAEAAVSGKAVHFLLESNPGPGLGLLAAYWFAGKGQLKEAA